MYYYYNEQSGESTWSYPVLKTKETPTTYTAQTVAYGPMPQPEAATPVEVTDATTPVEPTAAPLENYGYGRSNLMMWRSDLGKIQDYLFVFFAPVGSVVSSW